MYKRPESSTGRATVWFFKGPTFESRSGCTIIFCCFFLNFNVFCRYFMYTPLTATKQNNEKIESGVGGTYRWQYDKTPNFRRLYAKYGATIWTWNNCLLSLILSFCVVAVEWPIHKILTKGKKEVCDKVRNLCFSFCHSFMCLLLVTTTNKQNNEMAQIRHHSFVIIIAWLLLKCVLF
jgi:hypothetical protein